MFQPLLDAYTDSTYLDETIHKPRINVAIASWWPLKGSEKKAFKDFLLYFILKQRYKVILHNNPNKPSDLVFGNALEQSRKILSYQNTKRVFYSGENQAPDFNLFDYAIGFDELDFNDRYLRAPLYFHNLHQKALILNDTTAPYKLKDSLYTLKELP